MAADGSSDKTTHPLLTRRPRPELFVSQYLQASVRKMRKAKKQTVAATLALLLFVVAATAFVSRGGRMHGAQSVHKSGNGNDATLLLAKATGMTNSDEAKALLEALEDGTVDLEDVSFALEEDAARKAAKIKAAIENEASRKAAEEKAAAEKAAAEKAAAEKATAERVAAEKAAAEKAAAEKAAAEKVAALKAAAERIAAEKAAAEKAAAEKASFKMRKTDPQPGLDDFFDNGDDYYNDDEDDWLGDDFEDEIDIGDGLAFSRGEQKRSVNRQNQGGGRAPSRKENNRVPSTNGLRQKMDRKGALSLSVDAEEEEEEDDWLGGDFEDEFADGVDGLSFPRGEIKRSDSYSTNQGRAPSRKENDRVPKKKSLRARINRRGSPNIFDEMEERELEPERRNDVDEDKYGNKHRRKSSSLRLNQKSKSLSSKSSKNNNRRTSSASRTKRGADKWR